MRRSNIIRVVGAGNFLLQSAEAAKYVQEVLNKARADGHEVIGDMIIIKLKENKP